MRIIKRNTIKAYWESYQGSDQPALEGALKAWLQEVDKATWKMPMELKGQYKNASILKGSRVVFNICGNKFRLIVKINYPASITEIRWIGTHKDYDKVNAEEV